MRFEFRPLTFWVWARRVAGPLPAAQRRAARARRGRAGNGQMSMGKGRAVGVHSAAAQAAAPHGGMGYGACQKGSSGNVAGVFRVVLQGAGAPKRRIIENRAVQTARLKSPSGNMATDSEDAMRRRGGNPTTTGRPRRRRRVTPTSTSTMATWATTTTATTITSRWRCCEGWRASERHSCRAAPAFPHAFLHRCALAPVYGLPSQHFLMRRCR